MPITLLISNKKKFLGDWIWKGLMKFEKNWVFVRRTQIFCEITTLDLSYVVTVKSITAEILQNFVSFSEYMNFNDFSNFMNHNKNNTRFVNWDTFKN